MTKEEIKSRIEYEIVVFIIGGLPAFASVCLFYLYFLSDSFDLILTIESFFIAYLLVRVVIWYTLRWNTSF